MRIKATLAVAGVAVAALLSSLVLAGTARASDVTLTIPAGDTATLSGAQFGYGGSNCPSDPLTYGYTLDGAAVQLATGGDGSCSSAAGATIAAADTVRTLKIYLTDNYSACGDTYYSDGSGDADHALVTPEESAGTWGVSIMDCYAGGATDTQRLPPGDGEGNFNVTVTFSGPPTNDGGDDAPSISVVGGGPPAVGSTLQSTEGTWTSYPSIPSDGYSYQWQSCGSSDDPSTCQNVGSNSSTYELQPSDAGNSMQVIVTATNTNSQTGTATSDQVGPVTEPPTNTAGDPPTISGTVEQGQPLTAMSGTWTGYPDTFTYAYTWLSCPSSGPCATVAGPSSATDANTYTPTSSDVGNTIEVEVTATNSASEQGNATSAATVPVAGGPEIVNAGDLPSISVVGGGPPAVGSTLQSTEGTWTAYPSIPSDGYSYQWQSCGSSDDPSTCQNVGSNSSTYLLQSSDAGNSMQVIVTATNTNSQTGTATSDQVGPVTEPPTNAGGADLPTISGTVEQGQLLTATSGTWTGYPAPPFTYTYTWLSCPSSGPCTTVAGPSATNTYTPASSDVGNTIEVEVTATNSASEQGNATSAATVPVAGGPEIVGAGNAPTISVVGGGPPAVGSTLQSTEGNWTSYPSIPSDGYSYQWQSCGASCENVGSNSSTYELQPSDAGNSMQVIVTATNSASQTGTATSDQVGPVTEPPTNAGGADLPTISGTVQQGQLLTATSGTWTGYPAPPFTYTYTWLSCPSSGPCTTVAGPSATNTYTPASSDVGNTIEVEVTATNSASQQGNATSAKTVPVLIAAPVSTSPPTISGGASAQAGVELTATNGSWTNSPSSYTYQWQDCNDSGVDCANVGSDGTSQAYTPVPGDVGFRLEVEVTALNNGGSSTVSSGPTATVLVGVPQSTAAPQISGTTQPGQTLTASTGSWTNSPGTFDYQWSQCDSSGNNCATVGGDANTYAIPTGSGAIGDTFLVTVTAHNAGGSGTSTSDPSEPVSIAAPSNTAAPQISGTVQQGQLLTSSAGTWENSPDSFLYQWEQCGPSGASCNDIGTATSTPTYTPGTGDVGQTLRVTVTAHNSTGSTSATSSQTAAVLIAAPAVTGIPQISGQDVQGQMLTATFGSWTNFPDPSLFTYQWYQCDPSGNGCGPIGTASSVNTYTPLIGDVGHTLRVGVSATNAGGTTAASSGPTAVIAGLQASVPPPVLGQSTNLAPVTGTVLIKLPGSNTFVPVTGPISVPNGTTINATQGTVTLTQQLPDGSYQSGQFYDGEFVVDQKKGGTLYATLKGGSFAGCTNVKGKRGASAASAKKGPKTVVRQLWGNAHGNYTTKGRYGSASVSGTIWVTQDLCDGTLIKAIKDSVFVVVYAHPHHKHKVKQGQSYLIPKP